MSTPLSLQTYIQQGIYHIIASGEFDETNVEKQFEDIRACIDPVSEKKLVLLDLTHVTYVNSKFIGYLADISNQLQEHDGCLILTGILNIKDTLEISGIDEIIEIFDTIESGRKYFMDTYTDFLRQREIQIEKQRQDDLREHAGQEMSTNDFFVSSDTPQVVADAPEKTISEETISSQLTPLDTSEAPITLPESHGHMDTTGGFSFLEGDNLGSSLDAHEGLSATSIGQEQAGGGLGAQDINLTKQPDISENSFGETHTDTEKDFPTGDAFFSFDTYAQNQDTQPTEQTRTQEAPDILGSAGETGAPDVPVGDAPNSEAQRSPFESSGTYDFGLDSSDTPILPEVPSEISPHTDDEGLSLGQSESLVASPDDSQADTASVISSEEILTTSDERSDETLPFGGNITEAFDSLAGLPDTSTTVSPQEPPKSDDINEINILVPEENGISEEISPLQGTGASDVSDLTGATAGSGVLNDANTGFGADTYTGTLDETKQASGLEFSSEPDLGSMDVSEPEPDPGTVEMPSSTDEFTEDTSELGLGSEVVPELETASTTTEIPSSTDEFTEDTPEPPTSPSLDETDDVISPEIPPVEDSVSGQYIDASAEESSVENQYEPDTTVGSDEPSTANRIETTNTELIADQTSSDAGDFLRAENTDDTSDFVPSEPDPIEETQVIETAESDMVSESEGFEQKQDISQDVLDAGIEETEDVQELKSVSESESKDSSEPNTGPPTKGLFHVASDHDIEGLTSEEIDQELQAIKSQIEELQAQGRRLYDRREQIRANKQ